MRKPIIIAPALIGACLLLAGCGNKPEETASPAPTAGNAGATAPSASANKALSDQGARMQSEEEAAAARIAKKRGMQAPPP